MIGDIMGKMLSAVTRVAVEEILRKYVASSKFGYYLSNEDFDECLADLTQLLETSRSLKSAGDRFLERNVGTQPIKSRGLSRPG